MNRLYSDIRRLNNEFAECVLCEIVSCDFENELASLLSNRGTEMRIRKEIETYAMDGLLSQDDEWLCCRLPLVADYAFGYLDIGYSLQEAVELAIEDVREESCV